MAGKNREAMRRGSGSTESDGNALCVIRVANGAVMLDLNVLFAETKDTSEYYREAIRSVYGIYLDEGAIQLDALDGPIGDALKFIMKNQSIDWVDIDGKIELFLDELPYAYYNVAGHDAITMRSGAKEMLASITTNSLIAGICTNMPQGIAKAMFDRAKIPFDQFKFSSWGAAGKSSADVVSLAQALAIDAGAQQGRMMLVSASQDMLNAALNLNINTIGISFGKKKLESGVSINGCKEIYKHIERLMR